MTSPIPEAEAKRLNVYQIFGWNDSVIDYMKFVLEKRKGVATWEEEHFVPRELRFGRLSGESSDRFPFWGTIFYFSRGNDS